MKKQITTTTLLLLLWITAGWWANSAIAQINTFPYTEGFETAKAIPSEWTQENSSSNASWSVPTTASLRGYPNTGTYKAIYGGTNTTTGTVIGKLITPTMDFSSLSNPMLTFYSYIWGPSGKVNILRVYYRTSPAESWNLLLTIPDRSASNATSGPSAVGKYIKQVTSLPNPSSTYQIAFEGELNSTNQASGPWIMLDDISINQAPSITDYDADEVAALKSYMVQMSADGTSTNGSKLGVNDIDNWNPGINDASLTWDTSTPKQVKDIQWYNKGISGKLDLSPFSELTICNIYTTTSTNKLDTVIFAATANKITTIDARGNRLSQLILPETTPELGKIDISNNSVELDLIMPATAPKLSSITLQNSSITSISFPGEIYEAMTTLTLLYNKYRELDFSGVEMPKLTTLSCHAFNISSAYLSSIKMPVVDRDKAAVTCNVSNQKLKFSTLPRNTSYTLTLTYSPQDTIRGGTIEVTDLIDLSSEYLGGNTTYTWYKIEGSSKTAITDEITSNNDGTFNANFSLAGSSLLCEMKNAAFEKLTLLYKVTINKFIAQINTFPYTEGFETAKAIPSEWTQENSNTNASWLAPTSATGGYANTGSYKAAYGGTKATTGTVTGKLITPTMDFSSLSNPMLTFYSYIWGPAGKVNILRVYYRVSPVDPWNLLLTIPDRSASNATTGPSSAGKYLKQVTSLPNPSASYQIAFEGELNATNTSSGPWILLDDITINQAPSITDYNADEIDVLKSYMAQMSADETNTNGSKLGVADIDNWNPGINDASLTWDASVPKRVKDIQWYNKGISGKLDLSVFSELIICNIYTTTSTNKLDTVIFAATANKLTTIDARGNRLRQLVFPETAPELGKIDVSNNTAEIELTMPATAPKLSSIAVFSASVTSISFPGEIYDALTTLNAYYNKYQELDLSGIEMPKFTTLACHAMTIGSAYLSSIKMPLVDRELAKVTCNVSNQKLKFSTLPANTDYTITLTYSPQDTIRGGTIEVTDLIDLSSEYMEGSTTYTWYKLSGATKTAITDLITSNDDGTFNASTSLANSTLLCEMKNPAFDKLTLLYKVATNDYQEVITYNETEISSLKDFFNQNSSEAGINNGTQLGIADIESWDPATSENETTGIYWSATNPKRVESILWSNKKLAGTLDLTSLEYLKTLLCDRNELTGLSLATGLDAQALVNCSNNFLKFSSLPVLPAGENYIYAPQKKTDGGIVQKEEGIIDLSSEYMEGTTSYQWSKEDPGLRATTANILVPGMTSLGGGRFSVSPGLSGVLLTCNMTNPAFAELTYTIEYVVSGVYTDCKSVSRNIISLYPNPVNSTLYIDGDIIAVSVYNLMGKIVAGYPSAISSIDVSGYVPGVYYLKIQTAEGNIETKQIIVK